MSEFSARIERGEYQGSGDIKKIRETRNEVVLEQGFIQGMHTECILLVPEKYRENLLDGDKNMTVIDQIAQLATFPGACGPLVGLPDMHAGTEFPVGLCGVFDAADSACVVIPEAIGPDINCGVRMWGTNLLLSDFLPHREEVLDAIAIEVPINEQETASKLCIRQILERGIEYLVQEGLATEKDLLGTECGGRIPVSSHAVIGQKPRAKGLLNLGTLGSGNHYLEFQTVSQIFNEADAKALSLKQDSLCISVHTGSRGLGHRAFTEFCNDLRKESDKKVLSVPLSSPKGQEYLSMVGAAANYAYCNRVIIGTKIEASLKKIIPGAKLHFISDVPHNIAQVETIGGGPKLVIRKGSTRVTSVADAQSALLYPSVGTPVSVGGSMSTGSYLIKGGKDSQKTCFTTCHGSGRILRRREAKREIPLAETLAQLQSSNVCIRTPNLSNLSEESEKAYKSIDEVVAFCEEAGISEKICKLSPVAVLKG
ncbi:tRNA-splicing ligase RtcB [Nematocida displodere]|uniref:3'-phosphate/5'-hydroxy nucleic acid ligase n=1 Tax=Nematocida displodere TaxID=1805483 RepID=A0A177EKT4_9MICR|nr:tRNA-splicing ligase RtcB [Nematocida displodere]